MAAPRNDDERKRLYDEAMRLFGEHGYMKTTYSDIAHACGVSKSFVQHYFPKKELFVSAFFGQHLEDLLAHVAKEDAADPWRMFCSVGLRHFDFILNDASMRQFNDDVIASRELTSVIVQVERDWAARYLAGQPRGLVSTEDALTCALGGAYELIFQGRRCGAVLSPEYVEEAAFFSFAFLLGVPNERAAEIFQACVADFKAAK